MQLKEFFFGFKETNGFIDKDGIYPFLKTNITSIFKLTYILKIFGKRDGEDIFGIMMIGQVPHDHVIAAPVILFEEVPMWILVVLSATCYYFLLFQMILWFSKVGTLKFKQTLPVEKLYFVKRC